LGLALAINPDIAAATEIERLIQIPSALDVDTFAKGRVTILRLQIPSGSILDGLTLRYLHPKVSEHILVCVVERGDEIIIPDGSTTLHRGDYISVIMPLHEAMSIVGKIGIRTKPIKSIMIAGGGKISYYLAEKLLRAKQQVKIIERDPKRCEELSSLLPKAMIICGDASDETLLLEEGIENVDAFISLTNFDESNILMSLYANDVSKSKIITKISRISFKKILGSMPIGTTVFPKNITSEHIIRYVRAMKNSNAESEIRALYKMIGGKAEALELYVDKSAAKFGFIGVPLMDLHIKKNVIIGCINKKGRLVTPNGGDTMEVGDTVIVVTTSKISSLADIIEKGK
jgi:trk system potassium uptake protein TrkA